MARPGSGRAEQAATPAPRLTGRGAVLGMTVLFTIGLLMAAWLGVTVLAGIFFVLGCGLAARYTRPADLLIVVLTPPILFSCALLVVEAITASGSLFLSVVAGSVVVLATLAWWLLAGMILTVGIAWPRGLPRCLREFRQDLRAIPAEPHPAQARPAQARPAQAGPAQARPDPAGPGQVRARPGVPGPASGAPASPGAVRAEARTASAPEPPQRPPHR
jgi:hypothetical protein